MRDAAQVRGAAALPHRLPPARRALAVAARRHGRELRLGARQRFTAARRRSCSPAASRPDNVAEAIAAVRPFAVDSRQRHRGRARAQGPGQARGVLPQAVAAAADATTDRRARVSAPPLERRFGPYGGRYVPGDADPGARRARARVARGARRPRLPRRSSSALLRDYAGRPTPLYRAPRPLERPPAARSTSSARTCSTPARTRSTTRWARRCSPGGWASRGSSPRPGAGQHGVATATACALLGLECVVYMGTEDMRRQRPNVQRMGLLGAEVCAVEAGARTLKEAVSAAIRDWVANVATTHYVIGSAVGPGALPGAGARPPARDRRRGARADAARRPGRLPDRVIACVGGGSNAIGTLRALRRRRRRGADRRGGRRRGPRHAAATPRRSPPARAACCTARCRPCSRTRRARSSRRTRSRPGSTTPASGPEHAHLRDTGRVRYVAVEDDDAAGRLPQRRPSSRGSCPRSSPRTRSPGCCANPAPGSHLRHALGARRQGPGRGAR